MGEIKISKNENVPKCKHCGVRVHQGLSAGIVSSKKGKLMHKLLYCMRCGNLLAKNIYNGKDLVYEEYNGLKHDEEEANV